MFSWTRKVRDNQLRRYSDEQLCGSAAKGDTASFNELFDRHWENVFRIILAILRNETEAEDVAQCVFIEVHCRAHEFDPARGSFANWILRYAYTRAIDQKRYLNARRYYDNAQLEPSHVCDPAGALNLAFNLSFEEASHLIRQLLDELSGKQRVVIEAYFIQGYSLQDIAVNINETYGNTRHLLYRGVSKLRELVLPSLSSKQHAHEDGQPSVERPRRPIREVALVRSRTI